MVSAFSPSLVVSAASTALTISSKRPAVVTVPLIAPEAASSSRPPGSEPSTRLHEYTPLPPVALSAAEYVTPTRVELRVAGAIESA